MSQKGSRTKVYVAIVAVIVIIGVSAVGVYIATRPPTTSPLVVPGKTTITVGWTEPDTGPLSALVLYDIYYKWIIEDYNKSGGLSVPGYSHNLTFAKPIVYDDTSDINTMIAEYEKLITVDKVDLLFGPISTAMNYALFPICQEYKMPIISTTFGSDIAGAKMKTGVYSYAFSILGFPSECADQLTQVFKYINSTVDPGKLNKIGILYDSDQHGVEYGQAMDLGLYTSGFNVSVYEGYPEWPAAGPAAFGPMISDLEAAKVDVAIIAGYEGAWFETEANIMNYHPKLIVCGPGMETPIWVYGPWGLTKSGVNGTMLYDGWPATAYNTPFLSAWAQAHYNRSLTENNVYGGVFGGMWPFPASATFYAGLQCLFLAVESVGLNGTAIRNALATDTFTTILGATHLRQGESMQCALAGTINQWHGGNLVQVIWPLNVSSASIIYPMPTYAP